MLPKLIGYRFLHHRKPQSMSLASIFLQHVDVLQSKDRVPFIDHDIKDSGQIAPRTVQGYVKVDITDKTRTGGHAAVSHED